MCPKSQVNYKCKEMYDLSKDPKWCEKGFLDPYYNYQGYRSKKGRDYIKAISTNACDNCVAFIRVVLQKLKEMLIDGYFISEVDVIAGNYDQVKKNGMTILINGIVLYGITLELMTMVEMLRSYKKKD